jgi:hypothetical protein
MIDADRGPRMEQGAMPGTALLTNLLDSPHPHQSHPERLPPFLGKGRRFGFPDFVGTGDLAAFGFC